MLSSETPVGSSDGQTGALLSSRTVRLLKLSIVVMTALIAAGLVALVFGMKRQMDILADKPHVAESLSVTLPAGTTLRAIEAVDDEGSLWLHVEEAGGGTALMLLNAKGQLVRTVRLKQAQ